MKRKCTKGKSNVLSQEHKHIFQSIRIIIFEMYCIQNQRRQAQEKIFLQ